VVDFGSPFGDLAFLFEAEGADVTYLGSESLHLEVVEARVRQCGSQIKVAARDIEGSSTNEEADLAIIVASEGWDLRMPQPLTRHVPEVDWAIQCLRPGGWLALLLPNPWAMGVIREALSPGVGFDLSALARLHRLQFAVNGLRLECVRSYYLLPDIGQPDTFIPRSGTALRAYRSKGSGGDDYWSQIVDRFNSVRFPGLLHLARK
jgi:SAM-dependent methyltransferase